MDPVNGPEDSHLGPAWCLLESRTVHLAVMSLVCLKGTDDGQDGSRYCNYIAFLAKYSVLVTSNFKHNNITSMAECCIISKLEKGCILVVFLPKGGTVNVTRYVQTLKKLKCALREKAPD
uniref:Uncharacterized protein n=1 Tax=Eptatretus burgeri TaxID=7764 RepID=A0A8C4X1M7_EPTBU